MEIRHRYPLLAHTSMAIDVWAEWWVEYASTDDLRRLAQDEFFATLPFLCIGSGSNLLFIENYPGALLHSTIQDFEVINTDKEKGRVTLRVGSGMIWDDLVLRSLQEGYYGLENLSHIPGTVGASAVQNIGAYGTEASDFISAVEVVDLKNGKEEFISCEECCYAYRFSRFKTEEYRHKIITHVHYTLSTIPAPNLSYNALRNGFKENTLPSPMEIRKKVIEIRDSKLPCPEKLPNAGSFFMNPIVDVIEFERLQDLYPDVPYYPTSTEGKVKLSAAWLIDHSGLKGVSHGNVATYHLQPLVLVQKGGASGKEVADFALFISKEVFRKMGVRLVPEVLFVPNHLYNFAQD